MAATPAKDEGAAHLIERIEDAERSSLEVVRRFIDSVNDAFPDLGADGDGPRRKIIESAFTMIEQLLGASNRLAQNILDVTEKTFKDSA